MLHMVSIILTVTTTQTNHIQTVYNTIQYNKWLA